MQKQMKKMGGGKMQKMIQKMGGMQGAEGGLPDLSAHHPYPVSVKQFYLGEMVLTHQLFHPHLRT
jgi:hypothetical protein